MILLNKKKIERKTFLTTIIERASFSCPPSPHFSS